MQNRKESRHMFPPAIRYSEAFKRKVVSEIEEGKISRGGARRKYDIGGHMTVDRWCRRYGSLERLGIRVRVETLKEGDKEKAREERIRQLEVALADEKLKVMALETLIDVAERDLKVSIRKKSGTKQS